MSVFFPTHLGCFRLGNLTLSFKIRISDFAAEKSVLEVVSNKKSNPRSHGFLLFTFFGKCKHVLVNSGLAVCSLCVSIGVCLRSSSVHELKEKVSRTL